MHLVLKTLGAITAISTVWKLFNRKSGNVPKRFKIEDSPVKTPRWAITSTSQEGEKKHITSELTEVTQHIQGSGSGGKGASGDAPSSSSTPALPALRNEDLAHRLILEPDYNLPDTSASQPPSATNSLQKQIEAQMKAAYWESLRVETARGEFDLILQNLKELKHKLTELLPRGPHRAKLEEGLEVGLDVELVDQQLKAGAFDGSSLRDLVQCAMSTIMQLEAPARTQHSQAWLDEMTQKMTTEPAWEGLLPQIFEFVHSKLEQLSLDMSNWTLRQAAVWLREHGVRYEQDNFNAKLKATTIKLTLTRTWLAESLAAAADHPALPQEDKSAIQHQSALRNPALQLLHRFVVLRVLCLPREASPLTCPETLMLDIPNIIPMQNYLQAVTLIGALLMITMALLAEKQAPPLTEHWKATFRQDVMRLLTQPYTSQISVIQTYMIVFMEKVLPDPIIVVEKNEGEKKTESEANSQRSESVGESEAVGSSTPGQPTENVKLSEKDKEFLKNMTSKTINTDDRFYSQMNIRILGALWSSLRCETDSDSEQVLDSLQLTMKEEVRSISRAVRKIISLNYQVHGQRIADLVTEIASNPIGQEIQ